MSASRDEARDGGDRDAVDRAFAEMMANYHLTSDRPDPLPPLRLDRESSAPGSSAAGAGPAGGPSAGSGPGGGPVAGSSGIESPASWADNHPLFFAPDPLPVEPRRVPDPDERYVPEPQPPMARPRLPILLAWLGIAYAAVVVLLAAFGIRLPPWSGWLALAGFLGGFGVLVFNLPRSRPPDDDGAVL